MSAPMLEARGVGVRFGGLVALQDASLEIQPGTITALIGPNGAGKSTMLNVLTGFQEPTTGDVLLRGESVLDRPAHSLVHRGMVRSFQSLEVFGKLTAAENMALAVPRQTSDGMLGLVTHPLRARRERAQVVDTVAQLLGRLGIEDAADELAENLSYGVQKQVIVGRLLATGAELLMFDEPGAGLPRAAVESLGRLLRTVVEREGKTILLIDHNMELVLNFADIIYVLHAGQIIASGDAEAIRNDGRVMDVYLSRPPGTGKTTPAAVVA
jgi:ABC-type branched-subunit amino acid transport system ATPase component